MKIAIYKPFMPIYFNDDRKDLNAISYEAVNLAKILRKFGGHNITFLSPTDLDLGKVDGVTQGKLETDEHFDRIIIFSGSFNLDKIGDNIIEILRKKTHKLDFYLTDLRLLPVNINLLQQFNHIYTQATQPIRMIKKIAPKVPQTYGGVAELYCYDIKFQPIGETMNKKDIRYAFMGTERGRLLDVIEYVWRPDCTWWGKSETFNLDNRTPRDEFKKLLDRTKFSITIADEEYNKNHFITPRPYEHWHHDIINFVDMKFDPDEHIEELDSFFRVRNYLEIRAKMKEIDADKTKWKNILLEQRSRIKYEHVSGSYVYEQIKWEIEEQDVPFWYYQQTHKEA